MVGRRVREFLLVNSTVVGNVKSIKKGLSERWILNDSLWNLRKKYNDTATEPVLECRAVLECRDIELD